MKTEGVGTNKRNGQYVIGVRRKDKSVELVEVRRGYPVFCKTKNPLRFNLVAKAVDWAEWCINFLVDQMTPDYDQDSMAVMEYNGDGVYKTVNKII